MTKDQEQKILKEGVLDYLKGEWNKARQLPTLLKNPVDKTSEKNYINTTRLADDKNRISNNFDIDMRNIKANEAAHRKGVADYPKMSKFVYGSDPNLTIDILVNKDITNAMNRYINDGGAANKARNDAIKALEQQEQTYKDDLKGSKYAVGKLGAGAALGAVGAGVASKMIANKFRQHTINKQIRILQNKLDVVKNLKLGTSDKNAIGNYDLKIKDLQNKIDELKTQL